VRACNANHPVVSTCVPDRYTSSLSTPGCVPDTISGAKRPELELRGVPVNKGSCATSSGSCKDNGLVASCWRWLVFLAAAQHTDLSARFPKPHLTSEQEAVPYLVISCGSWRQTAVFVETRVPVRPLQHAAGCVLDYCCTQRLYHPITKHHITHAHQDCHATQTTCGCNNGTLVTHCLYARDSAAPSPRRCRAGRLLERADRDAGFDTGELACARDVASKFASLRDTRGRFVGWGISHTTQNVQQMYPAIRAPTHMIDPL